MEKRATLSISRVGVLANTTDFLGGNRIVCLAPHRPIVDHRIAKWMDGPPNQASPIGLPIGLNYRALGLQARNACGELHLGPFHRRGLSSGIVDRLSKRFPAARAGMVSIHFAHQIQSYDRVRLVMVVLDFYPTACNASRPHLPSSFSSRWWVIWKTASITGLLMVPLSGALVLWLEGLGGKSPRMAQVRFGLRLLGLSTGLLICIGGWNLKPTPPAPSEMLQTTALGASYQHFPERCLRENGNPVWINVAWSELEASWNAISGVSFDGPDGRNQELKTTLIRFLTSKGLTKDAAGIHALSKGDIEHVEAGIPTVLEFEHQGLRRRWDIIQFEIANWLDGGDPSGHSLVQRFAFLHAASYVYHSHPLLGVGTGDLKREFASAYVAIDSPLQLPFRLRAHNQYVTFLISGGPIALILWIAVLVSLHFTQATVPERRATLLFVLILGLSCLSEDTLETQAGVTFAGLFIGLFGRKIKEKPL